ncbi:hypothetical protein [Nocardiopsis sp. CC223A]|uniref:hypothetical protein n=1 Tax=Nocardiopsis sp. CC223A TaxID=3044051 RepID=UPI00278BF5B3|nr:hypothetical protein [Nocardiopsis sp. CC223A]
MTFNGSPARQPESPSPNPAWSWIGPALAGLAALATLGLVTPLLLWYTFIRLRNLLSFLCALAASALLAAFVVIDTESDLNLLVFLVLWLGGAGASFYLFRVLAVRRSMRGGNAAVEEQIRRRRELRSQARRIAATERMHAIELGIGRPDLGTGFDDGGLVDVNHAPAGVLARLPRLTPENLRRLEEMRAAGVLFSSAEELAAAVDVDPRRVPELAEYAVFL